MRRCVRGFSLLFRNDEYTHPPVNFIPGNVRSSGNRSEILQGVSGVARNESAQ